MTLNVVTADNTILSLGTTDLGSNTVATVHHEDDAQRLVLTNLIANTVASLQTIANTITANVSVLIKNANAIPVSLSNSTFSLANNTVALANNSVVASPSTDQDPVLDCALSITASVNATSTVVFTPSISTKYVRVTADSDIFIRTDANAASTTANGTMKIFGNTPEVVPVTGNVAITAIATSNTIARFTPFKVR
ncbi:hypothetical protein [Caulobacter phage Cr30]|uniref:hypothetical protein n=1 Tax=Caulobacter phage Cr30 TaxID=1357714 RepID=UPI0004A9B985|nr:hypothetical protein OZ74_gp260 [Caulobacter phage Cr30]AGS81083.1 hypothetical protein [Caulobacter phage Cr30]